MPSTASAPREPGDAILVKRVCERSEWSGGPSDIEGKTTRVGASECGQRTSFNRTRVDGNRDEVEGVVANTLDALRCGAVGFID